MVRVSNLFVWAKLVIVSKMSTAEGFAERLLDWFAACARDLPWRHERTPYRVWVAEVMLQQTRAETVIPYYARFLERFPDVQALAGASLEDVLKAWEGLGYYARARNLHAAAREIVGRYHGRFPTTFRELITLPGFGRYTAGAVASIAFGEDVPAVDGNARRVLCRVFGIAGGQGRSALQRELEGLASELLPRGQAGRFNEALMELGALVCTPRAPRCRECPFQATCWAWTTGDPESLPVRRRRKVLPHYDVAAAVIMDADARILVTQRPTDDMLGGLWEFPGGKCEPGETLAECLVREIREELDVEVEVGEPLAVIRHAYTHFRITLHAFRCRIVRGEPRCLDCAALRWVSPQQLSELPMSVADRRIARRLTEGT